MNRERINAEGGPLTIGADGTVSMVLYTGAPIYLAGWVHPKTKQPVPVVLDVAGLELPTGRTPILLGHDTDRRVGWADPSMISIDAGQVRVTGATRIAGPDADKLAADSAAGFPFQASIGADPIESEFLLDGVSREVNGRLVSGPAWVVHRSRYTEGSVVVFGADNATAAMVASKEIAMPEGTPKVKAASVDVAALQDLMSKYPGKESVIMTALAGGKSIEDVASALEIVGQSEGEMATEMEAKNQELAAMRSKLAAIEAQQAAAARVETERGAAPAKIAATAPKVSEKSDAERWPHLVKAMKEGRVHGIGNFRNVSVN